MDISKFVTVGEDGGLNIDNDGFQREFDSTIRNAVEKNKNGKLREEIRKELEEEAKLSAEQKLQKDREEFEALKLKSLIEINQAKAKAKLDGKGFSEKEITFILNSVSDKEDSLSMIDDLVAERNNLINENRKRAIEELQTQQETTKPSLNNDVQPTIIEPTNTLQRRAEIEKQYMSKD